MFIPVNEYGEYNDLVKASVQSTRQIFRYWDAFIAVGSMVGTFFLGRSYMCQWYIWIFLDTITVGVFIYSHMYWMALMYVCYIVMSVFGIRHWRKYGVYVE